MAKPPQEEAFEQVAQKGGSGSGAVSFSQSTSGSAVVGDKPPEPDRARGVDVSQGFRFDEWKTIVANGHSFAFIKIREGFGTVEDGFRTNWEESKSVGLLRGAYHVFNAEYSPEGQADSFLGILRETGDTGELPPGLDITGSTTITDANAFAEGVKIWVERVEDALGRKPILLCNSYSYSKLMNDPAKWMSWTLGIPLWVAYYPSGAYTPDFSVPLPDFPNWSFWRMSDAGHIEGVDSNFGLNYFNGSKTDLETFAQTRGAKQRLNFALNDRPEGRDRLSYEKYADAFAQVLSGQYTQTPLTVGIYAAWGMGKSFLLGKIREKLKAVKETDNQLDFAFIDFNAWVYSGSENLWAGLVTTLYDGIEKHYETRGERLVQNYRRSESLKQLWRTFKNTLLVALVFGVPAVVISILLDYQAIQESWRNVVDVFLLILGGAPLLTKLPDLIKGIKSLVDSFVLLRSKELASLSSRKDFKDKVGFMADIQSELRHISDMIKKMDERNKQKTRFIIFVDDLDRCPPDKAVEVLEAIMLLLSDRAKDPFIIFLAMDARVLVKAVEKRYGEALTESGISGYEFLDKIVQIPFRIPPAGTTEIQKYVRSLLYQSEEAQEKSERALAEVNQELVEDLGAQPKGAGNQVPAKGTPAGTQSGSGVGEEARQKVESKPPEEEPFRQEEQLAFDSFYSYISKNPRRVKRIVNIYRLARILLTRSILPEVVIKWVILTEQWPFRIAWVMQKIEDELQMGHDVPENASLADLYEQVRGNVENVKSHKLAMLDEDPEVFEAFIRNEPPITAGDIEKLWDVTFNLNPAMQNEVLKNAVKNGRRLGLRAAR